MSKEIRHKACGETHFSCKCGMFKMQFGKFKGKTLSQIFYLDGGKQYLEWLVDNLEGRHYTRDFIESFLSMNP